MRKKFNDTGLCIPEKHYLADTSSKLRDMLALVEEGAYFTINRPRQYGKTTIAYLFGKQLSQKTDYLLLEMSFEGIGDSIFNNEKKFSIGFTELLIKELAFQKEAFLKEKLVADKKNITNLSHLSDAITSLCQDTKKKIVLVIDEIDKSSNNQLFLSFLGMLREKYLKRNRHKDFTFQSVILIGVHDIKTLKLKFATDTKDKLNSPWNIAVDFTVQLSFNAAEIELMLKEYALDRTVKMDTTAMAKKIFYYTSGYPYLVSKLCKFIDEDIAKTAKKWTLQDLEMAFKKITYSGYTTTLFDSMTKALENDSNLYQLIFDISINGLGYEFNINAPLINKAVIHGLLRDEQGICRIHNRIFEQRLYRYFLAKQETEKGFIEMAEDPGFILNKKLNLPLVLRKFQQFMKENYAHKEEKFLEREGRLLFLSFLKPILNGKGFDFKEPVIGEERRTDVVITYLNQRYVVELKRWKGPSYHQKGLKQLSDYLDIYSLKKGYLLIFDFRKSKTYKEQVISFQQKEIFAVWV